MRLQISGWMHDELERRKDQLLTPDVIVVPIFSFKADERPEESCLRLRPIAEEYARRMDWGWTWAG